MKTVFRGFTKFIVANLLVIFTIMLLPAFIFTDDVAIFNDILNYLSKSKG